MTRIAATCLTLLLLTTAASAARAGDTYYTCSYRVYENGQPVVRRVEYLESSLQAAMAKFEVFLDDLRAQGKQPQHLGCR
ncbi:hypothetical protein ICJ04_06430 [Stenotrophomonas sp. 169]|uniref:hypothetical protein n=1 Tax=Stenotrophomonas sp. 169 TaxID=2770322 RepID=UPI0016624E80|nr:hypothetical protein [Stenotrophomonas sp. 169]QNR98529.1 hypothetical protein ICJ04_06430 [Stenotrophomonas sp. 169]